MEHNRLRHFRVSAGMTVADLAKAAGVSIDVIYRIERDQGIKVFKARQATITKLAKALDVDESDLFPLPEVRAKRPAWAPASTTWHIRLICPKCRDPFKYIVSEGAPHPVDCSVACPGCGFTQIISLRRSA